jgi:DNA-binding transcriptional ArsR family regulator
MTRTVDDTLSRTFAALADPTRRAILARLAQGSANVGDLAAPFDMSFTAVSKHLRVLEGAGLVSRGRDAQYRPAMLDARPLAQASAWIDDYRVFWGDSFDALDDVLASGPGGGAADTIPSAAAEREKGEE